MCRTAIFVAARALAGLNSMRMVNSVIGSSLIVAPVPATLVEVDRSSSGGGGGGGPFGSPCDGSEGSAIGVTGT